MENEELLATMRKSVPDDTDIPLSQTEKSRPKRKLGVTAFVLMLVGIILPTICFLGLYMLVQTHDSNVRVGVAVGPWFFLGIAFEIPAFVIGMIAWRDVFGKATVITISSFVAVLLLVLLFSFARSF